MTVQLPENNKNHQRAMAPSEPVENASVQETVMTHVDRPLMMVVLALIAFGLTAVYTASANQAELETGNSTYFLIKQLVAMGLGLLVMGAISRINFQFWRRVAVVFGFASVLMLVVTMFVGTTANGSERWISLPGGIQFQPSDLAKIAVIFLVAQATSQKKFWTPTLYLNLGLITVMILLILKQPNLSVAMILSAMTFSMLFVAGAPISGFLVTLPMGLFGAYKVILSNEYQMKRVTGWLDPWKDPLESGYNLIQSYYAIGSGGILGVGLGHSIQKLYYLPFQHTDFIFSVICEELGFFGAMILLGLFAFLAWRGFAIALNCPNRFGQMLAFGITLSIVIQALINVSVTVGVMPVTGVTLPLISYGGTSAVTTLLMIGVLLNISRYKLQIKSTPESSDSSAYYGSSLAKGTVTPSRSEALSPRG